MVPAPPCARRSPGPNGPGCHVPSDAIWSSSQRAGGVAAAVAASAALRRWRSASLLVAGDKSGRWQEWYRKAIPAAEAAYEAYLKERR